MHMPFGGGPDCARHVRMGKGNEEVGVPQPRRGRHSSAAESEVAQLADVRTALGPRHLRRAMPRVSDDLV